MDYNQAVSILNRHIFFGEKSSLLTHVADHTERFIGLFRPTKPRSVDRHMRLQRIYTPLRAANADLCAPKVSPVTGMIGLDQHSLDPGSRDYARRLYGVTDGVRLVDIVAGSPAAAAGLLPGDVITGAAKGAGVMPSTGWPRSSLTIADLAKVIESSSGEPITLLVRRGAASVPSPFTLTPTIGCGFPIELKADQTFNAAADGSKIIFHSGSFNFLSDGTRPWLVAGTAASADRAVSLRGLIALFLDIC